MRRYKCCGWDVTWLAKLLPCCPWVPPEWWLGYSRRQRRAILTFAAAGAVMLLVLALVVAAALAIMHAGPKPGAGRAGGGLASPSSEGLACGWAKRRLPPGVRPRLYRLAIQTDLQARFCRFCTGALLVLPWLQSSVTIHCKCHVFAVCSWRASFSCLFHV